MNLQLARRRTTGRSRVGIATIAALLVSILLAGCAGAGGIGNSKIKLRVLAISVAQVADLSKLVGTFEKEHPNIDVEIVQKEEVDLRDTLTRDIASGSGQWDVATVGADVLPIYAKNGWLRSLDPLITDTPDYDVDDIVKPMRTMLTVNDKLYGVPFYGEGVFTMYNKQIFKKAGLKMPATPTWPQIAKLAAQLDKPGQDGICLRGKAAWGDLLAQMANVIHAYGGNFYDMSWRPTLDSAGSKAGINFYMNLLKRYGESDPASAGFPECFNLFAHGKAAIWVDATSAAGTLGSKDVSDVAGKVGFAPAPTNLPSATSSIWSWNLAIPKTTANQEEAWKFVSWATSKEYVQLAGKQFGWSRVPAGTRESTYAIPEYLRTSKSFAKLTLSAINSADPEQPGVDPQPYVSTNWVSMPQWQDTGNQIAQNFADVLAGRDTVDGAIAKSSPLLAAAGRAQK